VIRGIAWLTSVALVVAGCTQLRPPGIVPTLAVEDPAVARTLEAHADAAVVQGNAIDVLLNGDEIFPAELDAIRGARSTITYEQYYWHEGRVATAFVDAFAERCRAGVSVHILLDGFGALGISGDSKARLRDAGCALAFFRPLWIPFPARANHRNHRRALVVDGRIGFTGGAGLSDKWAGTGARRTTGGIRAFASSDPACSTCKARSSTHGSRRRACCSAATPTSLALTRKVMSPRR
jgi:cardiolipin synthase A/B